MRCTRYFKTQTIKNAPAGADVGKRPASYARLRSTKSACKVLHLYSRVAAAAVTSTTMIMDALVLCSNRTHQCSCTSRRGSRRSSLGAPSARDSNPGCRTRLAGLRQDTLVVAGAGAVRVSGTRRVCWSCQVSVSWRIPIFCLSKCWPLLVQWVGQLCCYMCMCVSRFFGW